MLLSRTGKAGALLLFGIYIISSVVGISYLEVAFKLDGFFAPSDPGYKFVSTFQENFYSKGRRAEIIVKNPGDLTDAANRRTLFRMEREFDSTRCSIPLRGQLFWLNAYVNEYQNPNARLYLKKSWTVDLQIFSTMMTYKLLSDQLSFRNATSEEKRQYKCTKMLRAFRFYVSLQNFGTPASRSRCLREFRHLAEQYSEHDVTAVIPQAYFVEMTDQIMPATLQNIGIACACMFLLALIFLLDPFCVLAVFFAVVFIDIGILGFMGWWGVTLDLVAMITVLMSIGLSVDYSAHISYALKHSTAEGTREKVLAALEDVGYPVFLGAISTFTGVLPLVGTGILMVDTFFKVSFLVIIFGMLHGCIFLPVLYDCGADIALWKRNK